MKEISVKELKQIQLEILDDIAEFCNSQNISYFLAYGTLIGAIRHNGYIPWDDDIDIAMPRPDYDRFVKSYRSKSGNYEVICHQNNQNYGLPFAKVHNTLTVMNESQYHQDCYGVYVDVFPIDAFVNERQVRKAQHLRRLLNAKKAVWSGDRPLLKKVAIYLSKIIYLRVSVSKILDEIDLLCKMDDYDQAKKVGYLPTLNKGLKDIINKDLITSVVLHDFDGHQFFIPKGYDQYLRQLYGDYMSPPPIEQRTSTHIFKAWWK